MKKFYRVCLDGNFERGIYRESSKELEKKLDSLGLFSTSNTRPHYLDDGKLSKICEKIEGCFFCFSSLKMLYDWFPIETLLELKEWNISIFEFEADEGAIYEGEKQTLILKNSQRNAVDATEQILGKKQKFIDSIENFASISL